MNRPAKGARHIVVNNKDYYWLYRRSKIIIWADEKKHVYSDSEVTGWSNDEIERGKWKRCFYLSITPVRIAKWIREKGI